MLNKRDCILIKLYRVINLLNCLSKVMEKIVIEKLSQVYEVLRKIYKRQMRGKKH